MTPVRLQVANIGDRRANALGDFFLRQVELAPPVANKRGEVLDADHFLSLTRWFRSNIKQFVALMQGATLRVNPPQIETSISNIIVSCPVSDASVGHHDWLAHAVRHRRAGAGRGSPFPG